ncbi:hypothetical protein SAMN04244547_03041 [Azotobacter vinelandii]|nr:hypothetical protein SAMN04244547_03041 [Azotobacter vinelandii]
MDLAVALGDNLVQVTNLPFPFQDYLIQCMNLAIALGDNPVQTANLPIPFCH